MGSNSKCKEFMESAEKTLEEVDIMSRYGAWKIDDVPRCV